jgi:phage-related protein
MEERALNYTSSFHNENVRITQEKPTLLVAKINRLAVGSTVVIDTVSTPFLNATNFKPTTTSTTSNNSYIISASYDQGSETISSAFSPILDADDTSIIPQRIQIVILFGILSAISFLIALL